VIFWIANHFFADFVFCSMGFGDPSDVFCVPNVIPWKEPT
jgi:hypothetical protein